MGRKVKPQEAYLLQALEVFWAKGYEGASMSDLTEALGIGAQSIYNKFGDKEGLYLATMQYFIDMSDMGFAIALKSKPDASLPEIIFHFAVNRRMQLLDDDKEACYIAACALEQSRNHPAVEDKSNTFFTLLKNAFRGAIINAQAKGEIAKDKDSDDLAWYLVNLINANGIMKKSGIPIEKIDKVMDFTFKQALDGYTTELFEQKKAEFEHIYPMMRMIMYEMDWWAMDLSLTQMQKMMAMFKETMASLSASDITSEKMQQMMADLLPKLLS